MQSDRSSYVQKVIHVLYHQNNTEKSEQIESHAVLSLRNAVYLSLAFLYNKANYKNEKQKQYSNHVFLDAHQNTTLARHKMIQ